MTSAYEKVTKKLAELEVETKSQNIALQKEIFDSIETSREDDQPMPASNLEKLHKLESSLDLLENLSLINNQDLIAQKQTLLEEIKAMQTRITTSSDNKEEISRRNRSIN